MEKSRLRVEYKTRQPKHAKGSADSVDIGRSVLVCNVFIFLFSAAKASLFPFLTLYMRYLGFSAWQTGLIIGGKTCSAFLMAPLWARCAGKRNKRKFILMFSILMLAAVYLSLTLIPTMRVDGHRDECDKEKIGNESKVIAGLSTLSPQGTKVNTSNVTKKPAMKNTTMPSTGTTFTAVTEIPTTKSPAPSQTTSPAPNLTTSPAPNLTTSPAPNLTTSPLGDSDNTSPTVSTEYIPTTQTEPNSKNDDLDNSLENPKIPPEVINSVKATLDKLNMSISDMAKQTAKKIRQLAKSVPEGKEMYHVLQNLSPQETHLLMQLLQTELDLESGRTKRDTGDTWDKIKSNVSYYTDKMLEKVKELRKQMFLCVLLILVVGEMFCSPVEKVADDAWYDFLDEVDDLEKYGRQRLLTSFAFILFPILTTVLVDITPCFLGENINHQSIHFYMFGGCLGLTFVVAMFYPVPTPGKRKYVSKVMKGCRVLFCSGRNFLFIISLLVMGMVYSTSNYLFWVVQDLGGKELPMGVAVAVAAFSEFPMLMLSRKLVKKLSNSGVVALAMLFLSLRQVYYSLLWMDWAVVPIELLHSVTHTAMWWAMLSNPEFNVSTPIDRSIRSILSSVYFGVGYATGSVISGFVFDEFGSAILYRASAILVASWMVLFLIISRCIPKKTRIRYAKLLQSEDGPLSDSSNDFEEDWLEQALRDH